MKRIMLQGQSLDKKVTYFCPSTCLTVLNYVKSITKARFSSQNIVGPNGPFKTETISDQPFIFIIKL